MRLTETETLLPLEHWGEKYTIMVATSRYLNSGAIAVQLFSRSDWGFEPYATLSVNLEPAPAKDCFWLKDWSENEGLAQWAVEQGIAEPTGRTAVTGYVFADEYRLNKNFLPKEH